MERILTGAWMIFYLKLKLQTPEQPHFATLFLLDTSGSMGENEKIDHLNTCMRFLTDELIEDELASV